MLEIQVHLLAILINFIHLMNLGNLEFIKLGKFCLIGHRVHDGRYNRYDLLTIFHRRPSQKYFKVSPYKSGSQYSCALERRKTLI